MGRHLQFGFAILAGLLAGGLIAWVVKPADEQRVVNEPVAQAGSTVERNQDKSGQDETDQPNAADSEPARPSAQSDAEEPSETETPKTTAAPAPPRGDGVISGTVEWMDGTPCAGLRLLAEPGISTPTNRWKEMFPEARLERIRQTLEATPLTAVTDDEGRFEFRGIGTGSYPITSGNRNRQLVPFRTYGRAGQELELKVERAAWIEFELTLDTGERLTEARLSVASGNNNSAWPMPWQAGQEYLVVPGKCRVVAEGGELDNWKVEEQFEVPPEGLSGPIELTLKARDVLTVRYDEPEPWYRRTFIYVVPTDELPEDMGASFRKLNRHYLNRHSRSLPRRWSHVPYPVRDLEPGNYAILCVVGDYEIVAREDIAFEGGQQDIELKLPPIKKDDHIVLNVSGPGGEPVEDARLTVSPGAREFTNLQIHRGDGEYWLRRLSPELSSARITASEYKIGVECEFGKQNVTFPFDRKTPLEVRFGHLARLVVHVENLPDDPRELALTVYPAGDSEERSFESQRQHPNRAPFTIAERYEFEFASGPVVIAVAISGGQLWFSDFDTIFRREVVLEEGDNEERIDLSMFSHLKVRAPESIEANWVRLRGEDTRESQMLGSGRTVEFRYLRPGKYWLEVDEGTMKVRLPAGREVQLDVSPYNALEFLRASRGSQTEAVALEPGDLIRQVNGVAISGKQSEMRQALEEAAAQGDVTLQVQRDGLTVYVQATPEEWAEFTRYSYRVDGRLLPN